jgi:hypothetical protein
MNLLKEVTIASHGKNSDIGIVISTLRSYIKHIINSSAPQPLSGWIEDLGIWCGYAVEPSYEDNLFDKDLPTHVKTILDQINVVCKNIIDEFDWEMLQVLGRDQSAEIMKTLKRIMSDTINNSITEIIGGADAPVDLTEQQQPICFPCLLQEEEKYYHGSGQYFKCFRAEYIKVTAYGWGFYFANTKDIPDSYAGDPKSAKKMILFGGKSPKELAHEYESNAFLSLPPSLTSSEQMIDWAEEMVDYLKEEDPVQYSENIKEYERFIDAVQELQLETEPMSYIYEVILHKGKSPDQYEYLDLDKQVPTSQLSKIQKALNDNKISIELNKDMSGTEVYRELETHFKNNKDASMFLLNKAKIDGNTHSKGSVRVIFDQKAIHISNVCKRK